MKKQLLLISFVLLQATILSAQKITTVASPEAGRLFKPTFTEVR
jgi:hypothetical protein